MLAAPGLGQGHGPLGHALGVVPFDRVKPWPDQRWNLSLAMAAPSWASTRRGGGRWRVLWLQRRCCSTPTAFPTGSTIQRSSARSRGGARNTRLSEAPGVGSAPQTARTTTATTDADERVEGKRGTRSD